MKQLAWKPCIPLVLTFMALGFGLNLWRPLYLAPPFLDLTGVAYFILAQAWLPVWGVCVWRKWAGKARIAGVQLVLGIIVSWAGFALGPELPGRFWGFPPECQVLSRMGASIQYECTVDRMFLIDRYILEGVPGLPVVWPVSRETINL